MQCNDDGDDDEEEEEEDNCDGGHELGSIVFFGIGDHDFHHHCCHQDCCQKYCCLVLCCCSFQQQGIDTIQHFCVGVDLLKSCYWSGSGNKGMPTKSDVKP